MSRGLHIPRHSEPSIHGWGGGAESERALPRTTACWEVSFCDTLTHGDDACENIPQ